MVLYFQYPFGHSYKQLKLYKYIGVIPNKNPQYVQFEDVTLHLVQTVSQILHLKLYTTPYVPSGQFIG